MKKVIFIIAILVMGMSACGTKRDTSNVKESASQTASEVSKETTADGRTISKLSDGTVIEKASDGSVTEIKSDGTLIETGNDGLVTEIKNDGTKIETASDGTITEIKNDGTVILTKNDGTKIETTVDELEKNKPTEVATVISTPAVVQTPEQKPVDNVTQSPVVEPTQESVVEQTQAPVIEPTQPLSYEEKIISNMTYTKNSNSVEISNYTGDEKNLTIPASIDGLPVTYVKVGGNNYIETISFSDSVTSCQLNGCRNLQVVTFGNGFTSLGLQTIYSCQNIRQVNISHSVTNIIRGWCDTNDVYCPYFENATLNIYNNPSNITWNNRFLLSSYDDVKSLLNLNREQQTTNMFNVINFIY